MDNRSDDIYVASKDGAATVKQIFKLMKPHIEENFGVESEAAKIFTEAILCVMRSVEATSTVPHRPDPVRHTLRLSSFHNCI